MEKTILPQLARRAEDIQLEAKFLFPENTERQLRWCVAKGILEMATQMAQYLRTAKDNDDVLVFPDIVENDGKSSQDKNDNAQQKCAKHLYAYQTDLLEGFLKYENLLKSSPSNHDIVNHIREFWDKPAGSNGGFLQQREIELFDGDKPTVEVNTINTNPLTDNKSDQKKWKTILRANKLRIGNYVSVPNGDEEKVVCINGITKRKIGYATATGSGEKYTRLQDVKPICVTSENLQELLSFRLVDEYLYDGKNYYDSVYHEKILSNKWDLIEPDKYDLEMVKAKKLEFFPNDWQRITAFIISNITSPDDYYVKMEVSTKVGRIFQIYYPKYIHEVQNFIDYNVSIKDSVSEVTFNVNRKNMSNPSDFK